MLATTFSASSYFCSRRRNKASTILASLGHLAVRAGDCLAQIVQPFLLAAADPHNRGCHLGRPAQAPHDIQMGPDHNLGVHIFGIELQHPLMIVTGSQGAAQGREPRLLGDSHVGGAQPASDATGIERVHIVGVLIEPGLRQRKGLVGQLLHPLPNLGIEGRSALVQKSVAGVGLGIECSDAQQFLENHRRQQVVHRERIVRMGLLRGFKLADGLVILQVVEVVEAFASGGVIVRSRCNRSRPGGCGGIGAQRDGAGDAAAEGEKANDSRVRFHR